MSAENEQRVYLPNSRSCFVCGEENIAGLQLRFFVEGDRVKTLFNPKAHHCGYMNVVHGGIVAALLDETIAWAANRALARMTVTAELNLRYLRPVPGDRETIVWAEITKSNRRIAYGQGAIMDHTGETYAKAEGSFLPLSAEETLVIDGHLVYRGGEERVFDSLRAEP
ncbi:MAG TPA: PaaI family thioesterase [Candidatus Hydrogenedentes bacterium]|nr:PaaI family thioesterase [Candidatus Hydrogenedentota bacterium]HRK34362.1 PaaI family thioesterase [Candidatus Hydrogenedentota bacterium]